MDPDSPWDPLSVSIIRSIRQKMQSSFPTKPCFTIAMDDSYDYNVLGEVDPDDLWEEMERHTREVCKLMKTLSSSRESAVEKHLADALAQQVFGSNMIENAGAGWDITFKLCQAIFQCEEIPEEIEERDAEYAAIKRHLIQRDLPADTEFVQRSRREIVQHAKAASYIINELYLRDQELSEEIILTTHRILSYRVDTEQGIPWTYYGGVYRRDPVAAGFTQFVQPGMVRSSMRQMITSMKRDVEKAIEDESIDPVSFSAKYCHTLVNIHPFLDGNGRICRLILNAMLLKYGGTMVSFGGQEGDREKYLEIAAGASQRESSQRDEFDEDDPLAPKHYRELASFTLEHFTASMYKLVLALR